MAKGFKFAGETCVYCAKQPATMPDHVFAPKFFVVTQRDDLPQVPACGQCNAEKANLEHHLTAVLLNGGHHAHTSENSGVRRNGSGNGRASQTSVSCEPKKLSALFNMIAKGLAWHHWHVLTDQNAGTWSGILNTDGGGTFDTLLGWNTRARVDESLGDGTFEYIGAQATDNPAMSVWIFSIYDGAPLAEDPEAPNEEVSKIGVLIASKKMIRQFDAAFGGRPTPVALFGRVLLQARTWLAS
jgi:hypothetical protein